MSLDVLSLGPFTFDDWSTPEKLPAGGRQNLVVHKMPGGTRAIDAMGPDDIDRGWSGLLWGEDAVSQALSLDALRRSGEALPYSNGAEARTVVILEFLFNVRKFQCVEYTILITPTDSLGGGGGFGGGFGLGGIIGGLGGGLGLGVGGFASLGGIVGADIGVSVDLANGVGITGGLSATLPGVGSVGAGFAL